MSANKVYIGNVDFQIKHEELEELMKEVGAVKEVNLARSFNGNSRGFAIVEFEDASSATKAVNELNDRMLGSRKVFVREDRGTESRRAPRNGSATSRRVDRRRIAPLRFRPEDKGRLLYVGNIPWRTSWQDLKDLFKEAGEVIRVDVPEDYDGRSRGYATVLFENVDSAQDAVKRFHETDFEGRRLVVREDEYFSGNRRRKRTNDTPRDE